MKMAHPSMQQPFRRQELVEILMVDDHLENLLALEAVLASSNYTLVPKCSGDAALRYVMESDPRRLALILLDTHMPGMDGYETAARIRQRKELKHVPILFMTAVYKSKKNVHQGNLSGSVDYIFKPYDPEILRRKVESFVRLHQYRMELQQKNVQLQRKNREMERMNRKLVKAERELLRQQRALEEIVAARTKELHEAHQEIIQSNRRFRSIFYTIPNLVAIRRLRDGRYLEVNDAWTELTGYTLERMNASGQDGFHMESVDPSTDRNDKITYRTLSGEVRYGLLSKELLEAGEEPCELLVITDITEREAMQQRMNRLERLNLIGEMAASIAHEIRNPMTTTLGFLQMWKKSEKPMPKQYIDLMLSELLRANAIITEYLSLAGNKESSFVNYSVRELIDTLYPLIQAVALMNEKEAKVVHGCDQWIYIDEKEMRQVILNLVKNGIEAMDKGGILTIRTCEEPECAVIEVIDEGSGIPEEVMRRLGTPFFTTKENGTGIGLALCYSIIERHGGNIQVSSSPSGTTFSIRLPLAGDEAPRMAEGGHP